MPIPSYQRTKTRAEKMQLRINPVPNRSNQDRKRIERALDKIAEQIFWMIHDVTGPEIQYGWLPNENILHRRDFEDTPERATMFRLAASKPWNHIGRIVTHDVDHHGRGEKMIKASNRIEVFTCFVNDDEDMFVLQKPIFSPLPCDTWGRLPLSPAHWDRVAPALITAYTFWQWLPALMLYEGEHHDNDDRHTWNLERFCGWKLTPTVKTHMDFINTPGSASVDMRNAEQRQRDSFGWIGTNIYKHVINEFSNAGVDQ